MKRHAWLTCAALAVVVPRPAAAQASDAAAAAELFGQGRDALQRKDYAEACPKLAESQRLDPKVGTLINLARCEEQTGKLAAASKHWADAQALARAVGDARGPYVDAQHEALAPRLAHVVLRIATGSPGDLRVTVDAVVLPADSLGGPVAIDPGVHSIVASAAGHADARFDVRAVEGQSVELPIEAGPSLPVVEPPRTPGPTAAPSLEARSSEEHTSTRRWIAYGAGGLGVVALALGSVWGIQAINAKGEPGCQNGVCATQAQAQVQNDGRSAGDRSTVAFVVAGVLVAGGVALWLTAPTGARASTRLVNHEPRAPEGRAGVGITMTGRAATLGVGGGW